MATTTVSRRPPRTYGQFLLRPLGSLAMAGLLAAFGLAITVHFPSATPLVALVGLVIIAIATWMMLEERYEWTLAALVLYIGLADGYLKLSTGSPKATLLRDVLLYAI